jgi:hypothetical protein
MTVQTHFRIVFRGEFDSSPEIWSYSTKWKRAVPGGTDAELSDLDEGAITTAATDFHANVRFQSNCRLTEWRAYVIGSNGKMEGDPLIVPLDSPGALGTGSTRAYPTNVSLCVTTVGDNRGHARYGRFYLPSPHAQLDAGRQIASSWLTPVVSEINDFLKDISGAIDLPGVITSAPMMNISNDSAGTNQDVDHIKVGRVLDNISRRRNALDEDYIEGGQIDW